MSKSQADQRKALRKLLQRMYLRMSYANPAEAVEMVDGINAVQQKLKPLERVEPVEKAAVIRQMNRLPRVLTFCPACGSKIVEGQQVVTYGAARLCNYKCLQKYMFHSGRNGN